MLRATSTFLLLVGLAACETTEGVGRDVEDAGEAIQTAAE
jgi:predicted small secreted protein